MVPWKRRLQAGWLMLILVLEQIVGIFMLMPSEALGVTYYPYVCLTCSIGFIFAYSSYPWHQCWCISPGKAWGGDAEDIKMAAEPWSLQSARNSRRRSLEKTLKKPNIKQQGCCASCIQELVGVSKIPSQWDWGEKVVGLPFVKLTWGNWTSWAVFVWSYCMSLATQFW